MDSSITRRGQPCWYRTEGVGLIAINDAFLLEAAIYWLLKKHFRADPAYVNLIELFHEVRLLCCRVCMDATDAYMHRRASRRRLGSCWT